MFRHPVDLIPSKIFRAYDIRGVAGVDLTETLVHDLGMMIGAEALAVGETTLVLARDGRLSSPSLGEALKAGLLDSGCNVVDLGIVPTPIMYFATCTLSTRSGIMLTGSHNPSNYNGIKTVLQGKALTEAHIQTLYQRLKDRRFEAPKAPGRLETHAILDEYVDYITARVHLKRPLKVVLDGGNGVAGVVVEKLFKALGCEVVPLFCEVDGHFPNHHPDPTRPENLEDLIDTVKQHQADVGLAFDGDGDRLGVVSDRGEILWADRQLMLYARAILAKHPGAKVVYDVKCSKNVAKVVEAAGGIPVMTKTGHSFMKATLKETGALLAGELSGHVCFNDDWFGFDDGLYTGVRLVDILAAQPLSASDLFKTIPDSVATPEYHVAIAEEAKFAYMDLLKHHANFKEAKLIDIDGLRIEFQNGWGLIRPSNTTPCLVLRFEADTESDLHEIQTCLKEFMLKYGPDLEIPY